MVPIGFAIAMGIVAAMFTIVMVIELSWGFSGLFENGTWLGIGRLLLALAGGLAVGAVVGFVLYTWLAQAIVFVVSGLIIAGNWFIDLLRGAFGLSWPDTPPNPGENLEQYLTRINRPISTTASPNNFVCVVVNGNTVTITLGFNYTFINFSTGNSPNHETWFENGVSAWGGTRNNIFTYFNVTVMVNINNNRSRLLPVYIYNQSGPRGSGGGYILGWGTDTGPTTTNQNARVRMYTLAGSTPRTATQFAHTAAHEMGHIFGLADAPSNIITVMRPGTTLPQRIDVEMLIRAYATSNRQTWR